MGLKYKITHNGNEWSSTTDVDAVNISNGTATDSITSAMTKVLSTGGKFLPNNIVIGDKTLNCAGKIAEGDISITIKNSIVPIIIVGYGSNCGYCMVASNGLTWDKYGNFEEQVYGVAYGNNTCVISGNRANFYYSNNNGESWNKISLSNNNMYSIVYGNNNGTSMFVSVGAYRSCYSKTGINGWTFLKIPSYTFNSIACGNGKFVCVGDSGSSCYLNGSTWTTSTGLSNSCFNSIAYGNGRFVCVGNSGEIYYSIDGIVWTACTKQNISSNLYNVTYGNGMFVCASGFSYYYSNDGISWNKLSLTANGLEASTISYINDRFMVGGRSTRNKKLTGYFEKNSTIVTILSSDFDVEDGSWKIISSAG